MALKQSSLAPIIASPVLYKLAHTDHVYSEAEDEDIRSVANIFGITKSFFDQTQEAIINYFNKATSSLRNRKKENVNA